MKHLSDLKNPIVALEGWVEIYQKIDGASLFVRKEKGQIKFYGREGKQEITPIKRVVMDFYEEGIEYLEKQNWSFLGDGGFVHFEYFGARVHPVIPILKRPKNNLVLLRTSEADPVALAKRLGVEPRPPIFVGNLNKEQIDVILQGNFTADKIEVLNRSYKILINPQRIEGIVINTGTGEYKVTDKSFTSTIISKKESITDKEREYYSKLLSIIMDIRISIPSGYKYTEANFINVMFDNIEKNLHWIMKQKENFAEFEYGDPYKKPFSEINWRLIPDRIQTAMRNEVWLQDLVRLLFIHLSKVSKRPSGYITQDHINKLNKKVAPLLKESRLTKYLTLEYYLDWLRI